MSLQVSLAALMAGFATQAMAQDAPAAAAAAPEADAAADEGEIVITGSRIRRSGYDTVQPTTVVSGELLEDRAVTNVATIMNELPSMGLPGSSPTGGQGRVNVGQNFVNFFGLGSQRTLTLVNGKRFPGANTPSASGNGQPGLQVDLNTIPVALIERIESVAVGGAPIYGADAIAGTVNIILKKRFTGFDATFSGGISTRGDAPKYRAQALWGFDFADGQGNIVVNGEYAHQGGLRLTDRELTARQYTFQAPSDPNSPFENVVFENQRVAVTNFRGLPLVMREFNLFGGGALDANGNLLQFSPSGDVVPFNPGTPTGGPVFFSGGDGMNLAETNALLTKSDRYLANVFLNYDLSPSVRFRAEGWYSRTDTVELVNQPVFNGIAQSGARDTDASFDSGPYVIRLSNAFLTPQARAVLGAATDFNGDGVPDPVLDLNGDGTADTQGFYVDKGNRDLVGDNPGFARQHLYRALAGLEGDFQIGERKFNWDLTVAYGATKGSYRGLTTLRNQLNQAVDAVVDPVSGQIVCRDQSNGCVPLNIFTGNPDPRAVAFVTANYTSRTNIEQVLASANVSGSLFTLPAGDVQIAVGADWRRESSDFIPDFLSTTGQIRNVPSAPVSGSFISREIYGEALIPIVDNDMDVPLISKLELEGAVRYVDNSRAGGALTWTAGARYAPIPDVEFRGNFTRSIRAPAVTELFLPDAQLTAFADDPCDSRFITRGNNPARRAANCAAAGIAQPFGSTIVDASRTITQSGNPNLRNEQADAWTVGAVITPTFVPGLIASVDWVDIKLKDAIEVLDATTVLQSCYDSADFPTADVCQRFTRTPTGQIATLRTGYLNAGSVRFAGLTANLSYSTEIGNLGRISLSANYQYTDKLQFSITGSDFNENAGEIGQSKHRATASVTWSKDDYDVFLQGQYIGKAVFDNSDGPTTRDVKGVPAWTVFNAAVSKTIMDRFTLRLSVDNLFDRDAPWQAMLADDTGYVTYFSGLLGRTVTATARIRF